MNKRNSPAFVASRMGTTPGANQRRRSVPTYKNSAQQFPMTHMPQQAPVKMPYGVNNKMSAALSLAMFLNDQLPDNMKINKYNIASAGRKVKDTVVEKISELPVFKGVKSLPASSVMNASYGLSKAPNPRKVKLNSGIMPNTYANDFMVATQNLCAPMHLSGCRLQIPTVTTTSLYQYFTNVILFDIQTRAQANVGFGLDVTSSGAFSAANLLGAFNALITALHVYYYYSSILSYESDPRNKNEGMIALRQGITPQILSDLAQLQNRLSDTPCPPRIVQWIKYMNGNYLSGNSQGAPIIKLIFDPTAAYTYPATSYVASVTAALNSSANVNTFALIRRAIPQWRIGTLTDVPTLPVYDQNFCTIFANLPSSQTLASSYSPAKQVSTTSQAVSYNSFSNKLDGVAYAMCSVYNTTSGYFEPGLVASQNTTTSAVTADSRISWYTDGTTKAWYPSSGSTFLTSSRAETSQFFTGTTEVNVHLSGAEKCQSVSSLSLTQTAQNALDFLFEIDSIPVRGNLSSFNSTGNIKK